MKEATKVPTLHNTSLMHKDHNVAELIEKIENKLDIPLIATLGAFIFLFITYF